MAGRGPNSCCGALGRAANDGWGPQGVVGAKGVLYGTTFAGGTANQGTVFALMKPGAGEGTWTETVVYSLVLLP